MFVFSVRGHHIKLLLAAVILSVAVIAVVRLFPDTAAEVPVNGTSKEVSELLCGIEDASDAYSLLTSLGYEAEPEPLETVQVKVPKKFDALYEAYNAVQLAEGFNLARYGGKTLTRHSFRVTGVPQGMSAPLGNMTASVLVYKGKVVGGDLYDDGGEGSVTGLLNR